MRHAHVRLCFRFRLRLRVHVRFRHVRVRSIAKHNIESHHYPTTCIYLAIVIAIPLTTDRMTSSAAADGSVNFSLYYGVVGVYNISYHFQVTLKAAVSSALSTYGI